MGVDGKTNRPLVESCKEWIGSQHSTLFGRSWDIVDEDGKRKAAEWLADQIVGVRRMVTGKMVQKLIDEGHPTVKMLLEEYPDLAEGLGIDIAGGKLEGRAEWKE